MNLKRINRKPVIIIAVILLVIGGVIWFFASRPGNNTTPTTTNKPTPAEVIEITVEKLARQFIVNPTGAYKKGTVFQVSGVFRWREKLRPSIDNRVHFFLGPAVKTSVGNLGVIFSVSVDEEPELLRAFTALEGDREVVVRGTYFTFDNSNEGGVMLENVSLISVAPK